MEFANRFDTKKKTVVNINVVIIYRLANFEVC